MKFTAAAGVGLLPALAAARVFDSLPSVPKGWRSLGPASTSEPIVLRLALKQSRAQALEQAVLEMSTPGHPNYGMHMTRDEVRAYTAPPAGAADGVVAWLRGAGVAASGLAVDNDWVTISTSVGTANRLLDTEFGWFEFETGHSEPRLRTLRYSVPDSVAGHVDLVQPTTRFGQLGEQKSTIFQYVPWVDGDDSEFEGEFTAIVEDPNVNLVDAASCSGSVTPACLKSLYNINYTASATGNLVAFCSYLEQYARYADLQSFETTYAPAAKGQNFSVQLVNGGLNDQGSSHDSGEANLDVQYVLGVSNPIPVLEYSTGGRGPLVPTEDQPTQPGSNEPYLEFLTYILAQNDSALPQTLTTSYGEEEQSVPQDYALKICNMFMQLGARGVSVIFSSGDSGPGNSCVRNTDNAIYFNPTFPAGCPYVTSVGATTGTNPERAVAYSSGGFSIYHGRPDYQASAVPAYLSKIGTTYSAYFNASNRGIPDVAAQGSSFIIYDKGGRSSASGTSASSPVFAGIVALLNAARKSQGLPPLGFLNPWLYNNTAAWTDVTTGAGSGCSSIRRGAKWNATAGWDPVTGLGTPKFDVLLAAAAPGVPNA